MNIENALAERCNKLQDDLSAALERERGLREALEHIAQRDGWMNPHDPKQVAADAINKAAALNSGGEYG